MCAPGRRKWIRPPCRKVGLTLTLLLPPFIVTTLLSIITLQIAGSILSLLVFATIFRPAERSKANEHLMVLAPAFLSISLWILNSAVKWKFGIESITLQLFTVVFAIVSVLKIFSLYDVNIFLVNRLKSRVPSRAKREMVLVLRFVNNEWELFWDRLLRSKMMSLWPVYLTMLTAVLGYSEWLPKWKYERAIIIAFAVSCAFYGQRRTEHEQRQNLLDFASTAEKYINAKRDLEETNRAIDEASRAIYEANRAYEAEKQEVEALETAIESEKRESSRKRGSPGTPDQA